MTDTPFDWHTNAAIHALQIGVAALYGYGIDGDIAEFGCCTGRTAEGLAKGIVTCDAAFPLRARRELHLFDSFQGFPEADNAIDRRTPDILDGTWGPGTSRGIPAPQLAQLVGQYLPPDRVRIIPGWYKDTVRQAPHNLGFYGLIHIDCDFYGSTMDVLTGLFENSRIAPGALIYFDDWSCNHANPQFGERRAWSECVQKYGVHYSDQMAYGIFARCFTIHSYSPS